MTPASTGHWRRSDAALWRRSVDAVVLLAPGADEPMVLPGTAAAVWDLLDEPTTLDGLVDALARVYAADPETIAPDVVALLARLESVGAVSVAAP